MTSMKFEQAADAGIAFMPAQHPVPVPVCKTVNRLAKVRELFPESFSQSGIVSGWNGSRILAREHVTPPRPRAIPSRHDAGLAETFPGTISRTLARRFTVLQTGTGTGCCAA